MTDQTKKERERNLREIFRTMDADRAQEIREAYYKAVEGLSTLAESLEIADAETGSPHDHALIEEHLIACQAIDALKASLLGRIL
ncbi:MAG: hypothetical protein KF777_25200 [Planctomycetaceae bacterium]|nr:hypothetical protein [Planctomycetaceae bacterium]